MKRKLPNFSSLWQRSTILSLAALTLLAAVFRGYQLTALPPGLSGGEASLGISVLNLIHHGVLPNLTTGTAYAPFWIVLQAIPVMIFGHTILALRLWPIIIGAGSVLATWLWAKDWFGARVAYVATGLIAVSPWAVTLSRSASPAILATLLLPLTLWVAARALSRGEAKYWWLGGGLVILDLLSGPLGWTIIALTTVLVLFGGWKKRARLVTKANFGGVILVAVAVAAGIGVAVWRWSDLHNLGQAAGFSLKLDTISSNIAKVAGMFNVHGDDNFLHNFNSEPLLNAFVGLMFIAGLLVAATRLAGRRYQGLLIGLVIGLLPAILTTTGVPNDAHAAVALPLTMVLAAVGVSYMLDLWYTTFPINSAARSTGLAAILLLLGLTVFQGYVQTFRAWSGSAETYTAYDEAAVSAASYLKPHPSTSQVIVGRYVVAAPDEQQVVAYLDYGTGYQTLTAAGITLVPAGGTREFIITADTRDEAAKNLAIKFAGGKLLPHYSSFSQNELFYTYETTP